jgi:hypothetical protein
MKLSQFLDQNDIIKSISERITQKYPNPKGLCQFIAKDLASELKNRGINARHVTGNFYLDKPGSFVFVSPDEDEPEDEYVVNHDWVEIEGKILDLSSHQFQKYVYEPINQFDLIDYSHPMFVKYDPIEYVK